MNKWQKRFGWALVAMAVLSGVFAVARWHGWDLLYAVMSLCFGLMFLADAYTRQACGETYWTDDALYCMCDRTKGHKGECYGHEIEEPEPDCEHCADTGLVRSADMANDPCFRPCPDCKEGRFLVGNVPPAAAVEPKA